MLVVGSGGVWGWCWSWGCVGLVLVAGPGGLWGFPSSAPPSQVLSHLCYPLPCPGARVLSVLLIPVLPAVCHRLTGPCSPSVCRRPVQGALGFRRPAPPPQNFRLGVPAPTPWLCASSTRLLLRRPRLLVLTLPLPLCVSLLRVCLEARVQMLLKDLQKRPAGVDGLSALDVDEVVRALAIAVPSGGVAGAPGAAGRAGRRGAEVNGAGAALHRDRVPGELTCACIWACGRRLAAWCCLLAAGRWVCSDDFGLCDSASGRSPNGLSLQGRRVGGWAALW